MLRYDEPVFRPPSEARSLIIQATIGCSHNCCTFCGSYRMKKFKEKGIEEIREDMIIARRIFGEVKRIFLADGNAFTMDSEKLLEIIRIAKEVFPELERVSAYACPADILNKSPQEIKMLTESGLNLLYMGVETGHDGLLNEIKKGVDAQEMVEAGRKAIENGMKLSVTVITGLGGKELSYDHAKETAEVLNQMKPHFTAALTLILVPGTPLHRKYERGEFHPLNPLETLQELRWMVEDLNYPTVFRCNHASNYLPLKGNLPEDKERLLSTLDYGMAHPELLRPEFLRGL
jgi:radical SAM superfamily enzyme YgiQ (UPF0313 family)